MSYDAPVPLPPPPPFVPAPASSDAGMTLALGIIGLVGNIASCCCCLGLLPGVCAPIAWWLGARELRSIRSGLSNPTGEGNARTGMWCGIAGTAVMALYVLGIAVYVAIVGFAAASEGLKQGRLPVR